MEIVAEADSVDGAIRKLKAYKPAVLVLDINMGGLSSLDSMNEMREASPETRIVVLTMQTETAYARDALRGGASGYLLKDAADTDLVEAVTAAARGERYVQPSIGARLAAEQPPEWPPGRPQRPRGRGPAPDRARPDQPRDRRGALPEHPHGRIAPGAHPAEAAAADPQGARRLRARARHGQRRASPGPRPRGQLSRAHRISPGRPAPAPARARAAASASPPRPPPASSRSRDAPRRAPRAHACRRSRSRARLARARTRPRRR